MRSAARSETKSFGNYAPVQEAVNPRNGRLERVFVDLMQLYPNPQDPEEEYSPEEIRARREGWMDKQWELLDQNTESNQFGDFCANATEPFEPIWSDDTPEADLVGQMSRTIPGESRQDDLDNTHNLPDQTGAPEGKSKPRRKKVKEVKGATQTSRWSDISSIGLTLRSQNQPGFSL